MDNIEKYIKIWITKNGRIRVMPPDLMFDTYAKLSSMGYSYISRNKICQLIKEKDIYITKSELIEVFLKYLEKLDISKYEGLTFDFIKEEYERKKIMRENGVMKVCLPK